MFLALVAAGRPGIAQQMAPMPSRADPAFEVATIKPSDPSNESSGFQTRGRRLIILNETVDTMLAFAYGVQQRQIVNEPAWLVSDHFDVEGVPDTEGEPNVDQYRTIVRKLLTDRFHLGFHREQREMTIYALRVGRGGPRLGPSISDENAPQDQTGNGGAINNWRFTNNSMPEFAKFLQFKIDRPVTDQTALKGKYTFTVKWASEQAVEKDSTLAPGLFTALEEQIGLKLEAVKGSAEVLLVDHVERPSAN